jgi:hypothetical protein
MNKNQIAKVKPAIALFGAVVLVGAYAPGSIAQEPSAQEPIPQVDPEQCKTAGNDVCVNIRFVGDCPDSVDHNDFVINGSKFVVWQSVELSAAQEPTSSDYTIYFDPFKGGKPLGSKGNKGRVKSQKVESPLTEVGIEYKYTIVGDNCPDKPLDPRFRVRK